MDDAPSDGSSELTPRPPQREDFVRICRELNRLGARYMVVGGFACRLQKEMPEASQRVAGG